MKRKVVILTVLSLAVIIMLPTVSFASGEADELWRDYIGILPSSAGNESPDDVLSSVGFDALFSEVLAAVGNGISAAASFFALIMGLAAIISVTESAYPSDFSDRSKASSVASVLATATVLAHMRGVILAVKNGISELSVFLSGLVPVLSGILAAGGSTEGAATQIINMNIILGIISFVESELIMPLVLSMFSLSAISGLDSGGVSKIAKAVKGFFAFISGFVTAVVAATLSMQSVITRTKDSAYLAAARYAVAGMIPMVGGTVSSALATLSGGLSFVRSAVGVGSILTVLGMTLSPLVMLLLYRLSLSVGISFLEGSGAKGGVRAFSAIKGALDALVAVYSMTVVISVLEIVLFLKSGVNAFA